MLEWNFYLDAKTPGPSGVTETAPVSCHQRQSWNWITQGGGSSDERRFAYLISFTFNTLSAWGSSLPTKWNPRTPPPRKQRQHMQQRQLNAKPLIPGLQGWHHPTPLPQRQTQLAKIPVLVHQQDPEEPCGWGMIFIRYAFVWKQLDVLCCFLTHKRVFVFVKYLT